jgi:hypothetical protein
MNNLFTGTVEWICFWFVLVDFAVGVSTLSVTISVQKYTRVICKEISEINTRWYKYLIYASFQEIHGFLKNPRDCKTGKFLPL